MMKKIILLSMLVLLIGVSLVSAQNISEEENITAPEPIPIEKVCPPIPISMWCPNCDIEKYGNRCLCPMKTDEMGCSDWDCDACEPISEENITAPECPSIPASAWCPDRKTLCPQTTDESGCVVWVCAACELISERKIICCKITTVAPGMKGAKIEYIWKPETECPPSELPDGTSYEIVSNEYCEEPKPPKPEPVPKVPPTEIVRICAAKIKITSDKEVYYYGDNSKVIIEIFDSQGNLLPYYSFYSQIYTYHDGIWHTPEEGKTDKDGHLINEGKVEEGKQALGKVKVKVYTPDTEDCNSVEDTVTAEIRRKEEPKPEPVPCGIGKCVPEPKPIIIQPIDIPEERVFYSCSGCELESKCYPMGYRKEGRYCSENYDFVAQLEEGVCENNFECKGNVCVAGECISESLLEKIIDWLKGLFDIKPKPLVHKECSKLLIEKDLGDYKYVKSEYGESEHTQVPLFSKDGKHLGVIKCCAAEYIHKEKVEGEREEIKTTIVCPYNNREDLRNSLIWILAKEGIPDVIEYKGQEVFGDINEVIVWTNNAYLVASGGDPRIGTPVAEDIAEAYLQRYPSDLDITEDDTPEIKPESWVFCTDEDRKEAKKCHNRGGAPQSNPSTFDGTEESKERCKVYGEGCCEVYTGCIMPDEDCEEIKIVSRDECYWHVARLNKDASLCEKISDSRYKDRCLRDT